MFAEEVGVLDGVVAVPCLLEFADDREGVDGDYAGLSEACDGEVGCHAAPVAGGVDDGVDFVASGDGGDCGESEADAGEGAGHDEGFAIGFFDGLYEGGDVPGVDLALAGDEFCVWGELVYFGDDGAVGAFGDGGGCDDGEV